MDKKYDYRVVVDLDDTLSHCIDRDFKNAKPQRHVINRVNQLYEAGWEVIILTARGQLSCNGDAKAAEEKYREQIVFWLLQHGVKYHELSFNKPLATMYVDDKAVTPEDFWAAPYEEFKGGSGQRIYRYGDYVHKTGPRAHDEALWLQEMAKADHKPFIVPKVQSVVGQTIKMQYLPYSGAHSMLRIIATLNWFRGQSIMVTDASWESYVERVKEHALGNGFQIDGGMVKELRNMGTLMDLNRSTNHGDFTPDNMLSNKYELFLFDPIWQPGLYTSWLLDLTKFLWHIRNNWQGENEATYAAMRLIQGTKTHNLTKALLLLEYAHGIRVLTYAKEPGARSRITESLIDIEDDYRNCKKGEEPRAYGRAYGKHV